VRIRSGMAILLVKYLNKPMGNSLYESSSEYGYRF
jgi:hypothetical protein